MNARKPANRMLLVGVLLIVVSAVAAIPLRAVLGSVRPADIALVDVFAPLHSLQTWALVCGCAFIALSFPLRALHGRQLSVRHRRSLATLLLVAGVGCVVVSLLSAPLLSWLSDLLMLTNTGQDVLFIAGPVLFPIISQAVPHTGLVLIPASVLQRAIEQDSTDRARIFTGPRAD
ncbi:hypothetical protein [Paramicrobacterium agarici]|uniref:hypothetical protein n=1 Tax=Paramicrobacterium agarici TaxID=630514 RepID=UPI001150FEB1|nr:hypothetical protein [Microbacterium agarici]TQO24052.1 hypothetical protein FB385_2922 [Microbacterium agarici]